MSERPTPTSLQTNSHSAPVIEALERREMLDATALENRIRVRQVSEDGVLINQSVIKIPFDNDIILVDADELRVRAYVVNPATGDQRKIVINILDATVQADGQTLEITTDRMVRKGSRIYFDAGALTDGSGGAVSPQVVRTPTGVGRERFTLVNRAFKPTDFDGFLPSIFADASTPTTASSTLAEGPVETALSDFLQRKVDAGAIDEAKRDAMLDRFNDNIDRQRIPDHNLRAALLSLAGTFAEQAIAVYLDGENLTGQPYTVVAFADTDPEAVIADTEETDTGRLRTRVKPQFSGEPFQALSGILAHEALHQDNSTGLQEEMIATTVESTIWAEQLDIDEAPAASGTALVADQNTKLLALLNSGQSQFPDVGIKNAPLVNDLGVFYGASAQTGGQFTSFDDFVRRSYIARGAVSQETAGNPTLDIYMEAFTDGSSFAFNEDLLTRLDQGLASVLDGEEVLRIAGDMNLRV